MSSDSKQTRIISTISSKADEETASLKGNTVSSSYVDSTNADTDEKMPRMNIRKPLEHLGTTLDYKFRDNVKHGPLHTLRTPYEGRKYIHNNKNLSVKFDLSKYIPSIYNQGKLGACVAHSASQALRILLNYKERQRYKISRWTWSDPNVEALKHPSRLYIYYNSRQMEGDSLNEDCGCTNHSACMAIEHYKICPEDLWPYEEHNLTKHPPHNAYVVADKYKTFQYSKVDRSIDQLKGAIHNGHPVMIGVVVFPSLIASGSDGGKGDIPVPNIRRESPIGGHSILLVGYDDETSRFKLVNHWSRRWGNHGFGTISYDFLMNDDISGDFFAVEALQ